MKCTLLLLILMLVLFLPDGDGVAASTSKDQVTIHLLDSQQKPVPDVQVELIVYRFNARGTSVESLPAGRCVTGQDGRCEIVVDSGAPKDQSGFLRGALDLGEHGTRSVLWPGGLLEVSIKLNPAGRVQNDTEAGPFDYDPPGNLEITQPRPALYLVGIGIAVLFMGLALYLSRRSKAQ